MSWKLYGMIAAGGAAGALARVLAQEGMKLLLGAAFPYGTLAVNCAGSFLIGWALYRPDPATPPGFHATWFAAGFLGALTTFSTFSMDNYQFLFTEQAYARAAVNILANVAGCLVCVWAGAQCAATMR